MQAGGHRFDPGWLHQPLFWKFKTKRPDRGTFGLGFFVRLLFNNLEEVKRIRTLKTGFVWVMIAF